jgi:hypothetical protein
VTACFLHNEPASCSYLARLSVSGAVAKASLNRALSQVRQTRNRVSYPWAG